MDWPRLALMLLILGTLGLFEAGRIVARRRPVSLLAPALYGLGMLATAAVMVVLTATAARYPTVMNVAVCVAWLAAIWFLARITRLQTSVVLARRAAAAMQLVPWTAVLAPVGIVDRQGQRMLLAGGEWRLRGAGPAPLWIEDPAGSPHRSPLIGVVNRVWLEGAHLMAAGLVVAGARIKSLQPEVTLQPTGVALDEGGVAVYAAGTVTAVRMGCQPAFDGVWLEIDPEESS